MRYAVAARVFEVDHPAAQAVKIARLKALFGAPPDHVSFVAVDFEREALGERLAASGYDKQRQTDFM